MNRSQSRELLSDLERLYPQTQSRLAAQQTPLELREFVAANRRLVALLLTSAGVLFVVALAGLIIGKLTIYTLFLPILLIVGVILGFGYPLLSVVVLLTSIMLERFNYVMLNSGKLNVRVDEILAITVALGFGLKLAQNHNLFQQVRRVPGIVPLVLFYIANVGSTLLNHHHLSKGVPFLTIMAAGILLYATISLAASEAQKSEQISTPFLVAATIENGLGLIIFGIAYVFWLPNIFGVQIEPASGLLEATGTMYEGNVFGHFSGAILVLIVALLLGLLFHEGLFSKTGKYLLGAMILALATLIVTFSRGGWLGAIIGGVIVVIFTLAVQDGSVIERARHRLLGLLLGDQRHPQQRQVRGVVLGIMSFLIFAALLFVIGHSTIGARIANAFQFQSGTGAIRAQNAHVALSEWRHDPLFGRGDGSIDQPLSVTYGVPPWILSMGIAILHDSGLLGIGLFLWFLWQLMRQTWWAASHARQQDLQAFVIGIVGATSCMLIGAQFTNSMYLMILWAFLGLAGAMPLLVKQRNRQDGIASER